MHAAPQEYELTVLVSGFTDSQADLFHAVCEWLREQQPDLLASGTEGFPFEVDILDAKTADVQITLTLDEIVTAEQAADGRWTCTVQPQPVPLIEGIAMLGPGLTSIRVQD